MLVDDCIIPYTYHKKIIYLCINTLTIKIINPLYDKAFKYLMENEKFARRVLSVILDEEVESVTLRQQVTGLMSVGYEWVEYAENIH